MGNLDRLVKVYYNGNTEAAYSITYDANNNIRRLYDGTTTHIYDYDSLGNCLVSYTYDAWGRVLSVTGTHADTLGVYNPFRYRSYYYDEGTELYYLNSRYYDPAVGRFISPDDVGYIGIDGDIASYNLYAYCGNNPVMYIDPMGHNPAAIFEKALEVAGMVFIAICGDEIVEGFLDGVGSFLNSAGDAIADLFGFGPKAKAKAKAKAIQKEKTEAINNIKRMTLDLPDDFCYVIELGEHKIPKIISGPMPISEAAKKTMAYYLAGLSYFGSSQHNVGIVTFSSSNAKLYYFYCAFQIAPLETNWYSHSPLPHFHTEPHEINFGGKFYDIHAWYIGD